MKELILHCDMVRFQADRKTKVAEEIEEKQKSASMENALFVRMAIEKTDESNLAEVAKNTVTDLKDVASKVSTKNIMIYPYAHLLYGSEPASPAKAIEFMKEVEGLLVKEGFSVIRAPFGWYKAFEFKCKGHPLSELSRVISAEGKAEKPASKEVESQAVKAEKKLTSTWLILTPEGKEIPVDKFDYSKYPKLGIFSQYETKKDRTVLSEPPHVTLMREKEIAGYEPGSDPGNMRWYPYGKQIKDLIEARVLQRILEYGGMPVETPQMYDFKHPALEKYMNRFPARQYTVRSGEDEYFLRFSACFGQFLINKDMYLTSKNLPLKLYELTKYAYRREQTGELVGLRRLRAFTMPDMHTVCMDFDQARSSFLEQYKLSMGIMADLGVEYETAIRVVKSFYDENKEFVKGLVKTVGKPVLLEVWDQRFFYFVLKFEFNFVDCLNKASALSTVQIDVENAERFGIKYVNPENETKFPLILHCSISGAVERDVYAILEKAHMDREAKKPPMLPYWLSPIQVRVIPIADRHMAKANELADSLAGVRVDIDDRGETIGKKIRNAELDWIPYIIVVGDKEAESGKYPVRVRGKSEQVEMSLDELKKELSARSAGYPFAPLYISRLVSSRPKFN